MEMTDLKKRIPKRRASKKEIPDNFTQKAREPLEQLPEGEFPDQKFFYVKIFLVFVLFVFIVFDMRNDTVSKAEIEDVVKNVVTAAGFQEMQPAEARMVKRFYGLNPKDYEGAVLYAPGDNMDARELFVVKLKDVSQKNEVEDAVEERLETQLKSFEGYGAEQTALLEDHVLLTKGNYVFYIVGENAQTARRAFLNSL